MPRRSIRVILELVGIQRSARGGCAIVITGGMVRIHQERSIIVPEGVWF